MHWTVYCVAALAIGSEPFQPPARVDKVPVASPEAEHIAGTPYISGTVCISGTEWQAASANFSVRNRHAAHDARQVAAHCERWRAKLQKYWCAEEQSAWTPKCDVVVHGSAGSYLAAVGAGAERTFGSSMIRFGDNKKVARRAIDFRGDSAAGIAAVPHEMTHVILADLLDGRQPPRWADEGMAILADSHEKQTLHERDLMQGLSARGAFRLHELLTLDGYPHPARIPVFYGQSASVTACLAKRDDPAKFVEFLRRSLDGSYDQALRDVYNLDNIAQLERQWHEQRLAWSGGYYGVCLTLDDKRSKIGSENADADWTDATGSRGSTE